MSDQVQGVLPFNEYSGHRLVVHLRGPRVAPQFVASGGLLHAYHPHTNEPLNAYEYPQPPEWAFAVDGQADEECDVPDDIPAPIATDDIPFEEQVAAYVEYTAQVLFDLIQDTAEMQRVAQRFQHRKRPISRRVAEDLRDEQAQANTFFGEVLEHYCINMGADAAEALAHWIAETAETLDAPGSRAKPGATVPGGAVYGATGYGPQ